MYEQWCARKLASNYLKKQHKLKAFGIADKHLLKQYLNHFLDLAPTYQHAKQQNFLIPNIIQSHHLHNPSN